MDHLGPHLDDASLVRAVQAGDPDAFDALFRRHYDTVRSVCARRMAGSGDADEIAQASFVRAYERINQCTQEFRFGAWVQVIAYRLCADAWRASARTLPMAEPSLWAGERAGGAGSDSCEDAILRRERTAAVRRALDGLPRRQREVIVARDLEGRRPREVAAALALSVGAVDSLLLRARRRMVVACRATGVEHGGVSAQLSTTSVAVTASASGAPVLLRPLARLVESVTSAVGALGHGVAATLGLGQGGSSVAQRVAGLVGAGTLALAPLAPGRDSNAVAPPSAPAGAGVAVGLPVTFPGPAIPPVRLTGRALPGPPALSPPALPEVATMTPSAAVPPAGAVPELPTVPTDAAPPPAPAGLAVPAVTELPALTELRALPPVVEVVTEVPAVTEFPAVTPAVEVVTQTVEVATAAVLPRVPE